MSDRPEFTLQTYEARSVPVEAAAELFGDGEALGDESVAIAASSAEGRWVAGALLRMESDDAGGVASIRQLIVRPDARGRGIGGRLLRRAETAAKEHGCARIRSTAGWGCPDHLAMYDRLGYGRVRGEAPYLVSKPL